MGKESIMAVSQKVTCRFKALLCCHANSSSLQTVVSIAHNKVRSCGFCGRHIIPKDAK